MRTVPCLWHFDCFIINTTDFLTLLWTVKEAMSKVIQTGFTVPAGLIEVKE